VTLLAEFRNQPELGCGICEISYSVRIRTGTVFVARNAHLADIGAIIALFRQWDTLVSMVLVYGQDGTQYRAGLNPESGIWRMDHGNGATCGEDRRNYANKLAHYTHELTQDGRKPWEDSATDDYHF